MQPNQDKCELCYKTFENYCKLKCCNNDCCLACILRWLYSNFSCPFDRSKKIGFVIYNIHNNDVLYKNDNMESFKDLKENLMLDENLINQDYFYNIINNKPRTFIIKFLPNANITYKKAYTMLKNYGSVENFRKHRVLYSVHFYNITEENIYHMKLKLKHCMKFLE